MSSPADLAPLLVRDALPSEHAAVGALTVAAYRDGGLVRADSPYLAELGEASRRAAEAELVVAVAEGRVLGSVTFAVAGSPWAELAREGEAEFRMLAVAEGTRGRGVGEALVRECLGRAARRGCRAMVLSTQPQMHAAHRLYRRLGFTPAPERDWSPVPDLLLLAYTRPLTAGDR